MGRGSDWDEVFGISKLRLRLNLGRRVVINGNVPFDPGDESDPLGPLKFRFNDLGAPLIPTEAVAEMSPSFLEKWKGKLSLGFEIGAIWHVYTGEGPPVRVAIEKLLYLTHGNGNDYIGALGRPLGRRIGGLKAREYLVIPGKLDKSISSTKMVELKTPIPRVLQVLTEKAKSIVDGEDWGVPEHLAAHPDSAHPRKINQLFRAQVGNGEPELRMWRWAAAGSPPLLFVEVVWWDRSSNLALFAANVILEQGRDLRIISFNYEKGEWMRFPSFSDFDFSIDRERAAFLNAWKIGGRAYVLTFAYSYGGTSMTLNRVERESGLVEILGIGS